MHECVLNEPNEECWLKCLNVKMHVILGLYYEILTCHVYSIWMCLAYGDFKGVLIVSSSMGCYLHIAQVWLRVVLDVGLNVMMWFIRLCPLNALLC